MASVKSLQTNLSASLGAVGYSKGVGALPVSLEQNKRLRQFVESAVGQIQPENYLTPEQSKSYEELSQAGKVLEGPALENALKSLGEEAEETGSIEKQVGEMKERGARLRRQLQTLSSVQKSLQDHYASLLHKRDELARERSDMLRQQSSAHQRAEQGNAKIDAVVDDLMTAVRELCSFHCREGKSHATPPRFLSDMVQDDFHLTEDRYLSALTSYTKKQFFKGLADIAHGQASQEDESQFSQLDLDDTAQVILKGVTEEQHQKHRQELSRLQALYPLTEVRYINAELSKGYSEAALSRAKQELDALQQVLTTGDVNSNSLRQLFAEKQESVKNLRARIQELGQTQLTELLQDMAALQVMRVLHGDYDLKIARQNYFTSKQDEVISCLQSQRARHELLSMLYEVELRKHRDTHRLLTTAEKHLSQLKDEGEKRISAEQSPSLRHVEAPRVSIDTNDTFAVRLCAILGVKGSRESLVLSHASLQKAVEQLAHQLTSLQGIADTNDTELKKICQEQDSLCAELEMEVFGHSREEISKPVLTVDEYAQQCAKLTSVVTSLEQNIKKLLKDYEGKKKVLQANPLLETERRLFVYFFTKPHRLNQAVADLAKRVDSMALATSNKQQ